MINISLSQDIKVKSGLTLLNHNETSFPRYITFEKFPFNFFGYVIIGFNKEQWIEGKYLITNVKFLSNDYSDGNSVDYYYHPFIESYMKFGLLNQVMLDSNDMLFELFSRTYTIINYDTTSRSFLNSDKDYIKTNIIDSDSLFWSNEKPDTIYKIFECSFYAVVINTLIETKKNNLREQKNVKLLVPLSNGKDVFRSLENYESGPTGYKRSKDRLILVE